MVLQYVTQPAGLASLNRGAGTVLYGRGQIGSIWWKKCRPQPFPFLLFLFYGFIRQVKVYRYSSIPSEDYLLFLNIFL